MCQEGGGKNKRADPPVTMSEMIRSRWMLAVLLLLVALTLFFELSGDAHYGTRGLLRNIPWIVGVALSLPALAPLGVVFPSELVLPLPACARDPFVPPKP